jgi:hypothetical protein
VLTPAADARAADWITAALTTFAKDVNSVVPGGFEAYVRVFHPARTASGLVSWRDLAEAHGRQAHAGMQFWHVVGRWQMAGEPLSGSLPEALRTPVADVLVRHTATPGDCWFAFWNGFAETRDALRHAPAFAVPARGYFLLRGRVEEVAQGVGTQSANIWWPDDRAWCVATEVDFNTTYIGCSAACRDDLLARADLEVYEIDPGHGITYLSDTINPSPPLRG